MTIRRLLALVTLALLPATAVAPAGAGAAPAVVELDPVTTDRYEALPLEELYVKTRYGNVYVELIRPDVPEGKRVPVILTYTPYAAFLSSANDGLAEFFVPKGYARALAHVIGTGNSGGCWDYGGPHEAESAYDLVETLGTAPWSNGKVGMIGGSYDGTTGNMAAVLNPPHLATIVPQVAISSWYYYAYHDGVRYFTMDPAQRQGVIINEQGFDTPAAFDFGLALVPPLDPDGPEYENAVVNRLCPGFEKVNHTEEGYDFEPNFDRFWERRDYRSRARNLAIRDGQEISVLVQGGWRDYNVKHSESTRWFERIPVDDRRTAADEGVPFKMLVMGQGAHGSIEDDFRFPFLLHAWFDHFLYGYKTGIRAQPMSISKTNDGVIHRDATWPPPGTEDVRLYLDEGERLSLDRPGMDGGEDSYLDTGLMTESDALALRGEPNHQVLWYVSEPLKRDLRMAGQPQLDLWAESSATSTHYTPVLFDLGEPVTVTESICTYLTPQDACTVSRGFLNARYRETLKRGKDLVPGQRYHAPVRFIENDWVFKKGHRIAVAVMSSNVWWALSDQQRSENTIMHHATCPSALSLPIVGGAAAAAQAGL